MTRLGVIKVDTMMALTGTVKIITGKRNIAWL